MSTRTFLLVMAALAFLQGTVLPSVFLEGLVILLFLLSRDARTESLTFPVFVSGLMFDLVQTAQLGLNALLFMLFALLIFGVSHKTPARKPLVGGALAALLALVRAKVILGSVSTLSLLLVFLLTVAIFSQGNLFLRGGRIKL